MILTINSDYLLNKINWFVFVIQAQSINCEPEIHLSSRNTKWVHAIAMLFFRLSVNVPQILNCLVDFSPSGMKVKVLEANKL